MEELSNTHTEHRHHERRTRDTTESIARTQPSCRAHLHRHHRRRGWPTVHTHSGLTCRSCLSSSYFSSSSVAVRIWPWTSTELVPRESMAPWGRHPLMSLACPKLASSFRVLWDPSLRLRSATLVSSWPHCSVHWCLPYHGFWLGCAGVLVPHLVAQSLMPGNRSQVFDPPAGCTVGWGAQGSLSSVDRHAI